MLKNYISIVLSAFIVFIYSSKTEAQYFGQNKVNYDDFNFEELHSKNFDVYFYPEEKPAIYDATQMAERWYSRHYSIFGDSLKGKQPLIMYASFAQFAENNVSQGFIGQGTGGFTEPLKRRIVLPFAGPLRETDHVIGHELVHAFQYNISHSTGPGAYSRASIESLPLWFIEGMAEYFSLGPNDTFTSMWMRDAALKELPDISDLNNPYKYFPYRYGQSLLAYIGGKWGDKKLISLLVVGSRSGNLKKSIDSLLSVSTDSLSTLWHDAIHEQADSVKKITSMSSDYGPLLIGSKGKDDDNSDLNISPVLSPDGKYIAFYSSRNLFSIDIFLADAKTGKVKKTILSTELDPHLQSLEFINSAGAWNPAGDKFVFSTTKDGRPTLSILDLTSDEIENEIRFKSLGQIFNASWSPDGKSIVFSALKGGFSNLFQYSFDTKELTQLTDDAYAELQPEWSPDGKTIALVTDRFTTNLDSLAIGDYQIALFNPETKEFKELPNFENAKNINPQWSKDGSNIYFLSDQNGITNIYELNLETKKTTQLTNLYTGVSGITSLSPALSVENNKIIYSSFEYGKYNIYSLDSTKTEPAKNIAKLKNLFPGNLPPEKRTDSMLVANLNNPSMNLPSKDDFNVTGYDASLSLPGVVQPSVGIGIDRYGTNVGGGVGLFWSDMLGNHNLTTFLQIASYRSFKFTDIAALVGYVNTASRWHWGGSISQIPYVYSSYGAGYTYVNNEPAYVEQQIINREIIRNLSGSLYYPFSQVMRVEFSAGYQNISFQNEAITQAVSLNTGNIIQDNSQDLPHASALNFGSVSSALVYDNSIFGATSPILGQRFRIETTPTFGSLNMINLLVDYRKYFMPIRPFTIAARVFHFGRYGKDADNNRIYPLSIGYPGFVRGYDNNSFDYSEFLTDSAQTTNLYNDLYGSKMLVGNLEIRWPFFGLLGIGSGYYGFFPIETGLFYDTGVAWYNHDKVSLFSAGGKKLISSYGATIRINLFGYAVGEVDYVHPIQRQGNKWMWEFNLIQGF